MVQYRRGGNMKRFNKILYSTLASSIIFFCFGLILFLKPELTINSISYLLGSVLIIIGFINFIRYVLDNDKIVKKFDVDLIYGIIGMVAGVVLILNPTAIATVVPFILGMIIVISSAIKLQYSLVLKQYESSNWKPVFVISIISLIWGIILVFNPFKGAVVITKIIGVFVMVYAILEFSEVIFFQKNLKILKKSLEKK